MSALANAGEIIVSEANGKIVGAVAFVGPGKPKAEFFRLEWAIIRMIVVAPASRGHGIGRALVEEKWLRSFGQFFIILKWKPCLFSGCLFNRRQHHGKSLVWCSSL